MFKRFFKHAKQSETIDREPTTGRESEIRRELAMRASIANKLRNYDSNEDTAISNFTLADDETEKKRDMKSTRIKTRDAWARPTRVRRVNETRKPAGQG